MIVPPGQSDAEGGRRTRVKFCGMTRPGDVAFAVSLGVDALGVVFAESPRCLEIPAAAEVLGVVPETIGKVGVFADQPEAFVREAARRCDLDWIQLSGNEPAALASALAATGIPVIKAIHVSTHADLIAAAAYPAAGFLLDAPVAGERKGGTGTAFDWAEVHVLPWPRWEVIVAGGLTPENVGEAIIRFRPGGVDVSSGIEEVAGLKDRGKMERFMEVVRATDARINAVGGGSGGTNSDDGGRSGSDSDNGSEDGSAGDSDDSGTGTGSMRRGAEHE